MTVQEARAVLAVRNAAPLTVTVRKVRAEAARIVFADNYSKRGDK